MKKYQKAEMIAKKMPNGSYAAGCPAQERGDCPRTIYSCNDCERTR